MDDIERNDDGADDEYDEQIEQMIIENGILLHSLADVSQRALHVTAIGLNTVICQGRNAQFHADLVPQFEKRLQQVSGSCVSHADSNSLFTAHERTGGQRLAV